MAEGIQSGCVNFTDFLVKQNPNYDKIIINDIRASVADLMGYYQTGAWDAYSGSEHTFDRVNAVYPNTTNAWINVDGSSCFNPSMCDTPANRIGMGWTRTTYALVKQPWESDLFCFDQIMMANRAKESFRNYVSNVLSPATRIIMNDIIQKKALELASKFIIAKTGLPEGTFSWSLNADGTGEGYVYLHTSDDPTSKLTAPLLQTFVDPLSYVGGAQVNENGITGLQFHTDKESFYDMVQNNPTLNVNYRIQVGEFAMSAKEYYKYGMRGYIGDYMIKALQRPLRFNKVSAGLYQVVQPGTNVSATEGIKDEFNVDYQNAQYQISFSNNPGAMRVLGFQAASVHPEMPFMIRDYGGKWRFVTNNLGADCNGRAIDNSRGNKGKFIADFQLGFKPERPEWLYAVFHKRSKPCFAVVDVCTENPDPGYPAQDYNSENATCASVFTWTPVLNGGSYVVDANTITCNGNPATHNAISETSLAALVEALGLEVPELGTWSVYGTTQIRLTGSACEDVNVPFVTA